MRTSRWGISLAGAGRTLSGRSRRVLHRHGYDGARGLTATQLRIIGDLALAFGDGTVRVTADQNVVLRWIRRVGFEELYRRLTAASLARAGAGTLADVTSCPGAESCRLAVTQSRGLARLLVDGLEQRPDIVEATPGLNIKISGCPNGCGQHHIAGLGFQGSLRKVGGRPAPHYFVMIGGGTDRRGTTFGPQGGDRGRRDARWEVGGAPR